MRVDVDTFIKNYRPYKKCEALIHLDGTIEYIKSNHIDTLLEKTGKTMDNVMKILGNHSSLIHWLTEKTRIISIWNIGYCTPKELTQYQKNTLGLLIQKGIIENNKMK